MPADNARDVPDVALNASDNHDPYLVYTGGSLQLYGGTSVPTPSFAGLIVLLNQHLGSGGVGNVNPKLYSLAQSSPAIFHDVTTGNNIVTVSCPSRDPNCAATPVGYYAGVGYDQATGLGSVDAYKLVMGWNGGSTTPPSPQIDVTLLSNLNTVASNDVVYLTATVTSTTGTTPSGSISFSIGGTSLGSAVLTGSAEHGDCDTGGERLAIAVRQRNDHGHVQQRQQRFGNGERHCVGIRLGAAPAIAGITNGATYKPSFAPGSILSVFGSNLSPVTQSASSVPLPLSISGVAVLVNGIAAPLYYVSAESVERTDSL